MTAQVSVANNKTTDVRSAWDTVKMQVTYLAATSACGALALGYGVSEALNGYYLTGILFGVVAAMNAKYFYKEVEGIRNNLSKLPAPPHP